MAEAEPRCMCIGASGAASVEGLKGLELVLCVGPFKSAATLATGCLDNLQLTVKCVYFCHNVKHPHRSVIFSRS